MQIDLDSIEIGDLIISPNRIGIISEKEFLKLQDFSYKEDKFVLSWVFKVNWAPKSEIQSEWVQSNTITHYLNSGEWKLQKL